MNAKVYNTVQKNQYFVALPLLSITAEMRFE